MTARAALIAAMLLIPAEGALAQPGEGRPHPMAVTRTVAFPGCCPRPAWWDEVEIDRVITTPAEFQALWQDKGLNDRQKAKAMFRAIEDHHPRNPDIAAPALTYYYWVDRKYPYMRQLYEVAAAAYIDFDRSLERYSGKSGDLSAGMINRLAKIYLSEGLPERAEPLLDYMVRVREAEINDHLLETASAHLGEALLQLGRTEEAVARLVYARDSYDGDWEERIGEKLNTARSAMGLRYYLHDTRFSLPVSALVGLALVMFLVLRGRADRRARRPN